jgi:histidinol-phosphate aminotransferase
LLQEFDKVRPPYNINVLTQAAAEFLLEHSVELAHQAALLRVSRSDLVAALAAMDGVEVFPSAANFLLIRLTNADKVFAGLLQRRVLVKNAGKMHPLLQNCLRVNVSTPEENTLFLAALRETLKTL